jgi:hypothetical protein
VVETLFSRNQAAQPHGSSPAGPPDPGKTFEF